MAVVGEAHIIVRAITSKVDGDIKRGFGGLNTGSAKTAGAKFAKAFSEGFNKNPDAGGFTRLGDAVDAVGKKFEGAAHKFSNLVKTGYVMQTAVGTLVGALSALIGGLVSLGGIALGAASSLVVVGNAGFAMGAGMIAAKLALGGVGKALSALSRQGAQGAATAQAVQAAEQRLAQVIETNRENLIDANNAVRDAQLSLNEAIKQGQEEIQQLGFDAEDAALSENKAALELEKAREALARVQDLPPNSRARREAELAYQEAELNLRKAKDKSADLNKEQDRLAKTGVAGTSAVISATKALAEAEARKSKTVRDGLRAEADAQQAVADAKKGSGGGSDPFYGLNQFQIDFVQFLMGLKPLLTQLKTDIAGAFLPPLQEAITTLVDGLFPTIDKGLTQVATSMGVAVKNIANVMVEAKNVANLGTLFETSSKLIETFGSVIGNVYSGMLSVLVAAAPQAQRFASFVETATGKFKAFAQSPAGEKAMSDFFTQAGDAAAEFGKVFGNIFAGLGGIIKANMGPGSGGQYLLDWLVTATQKFRDMGKAGEDGISPMQGYFKDVAVNAQKILSAVGALVSQLAELGRNKAIGETFDILAKGAEPLGKIAQAGVEAGPSLAKLVVAILRISAALADSAQPIAFFDTLRIIAEKVAAFFESKLVQDILGVISPLLGIAGAIGTIGTVAAMAFGIAAAWIGIVRGQLTLLFQTLEKNPAILIILAIAAAVVYLYNTNAEFAAQMDAVFASLVGAFNQVAAAVMPIIQTLITSLIPVFQAVADAVGQILIAILPLIPMLLSALLPAFMAIITALLPLVQMVATQVIPIFAQLITSLVPVITTIIGILIPVIMQLVQAFVPLIVQIVQMVVPVIMQLVQAFLPLITMIIATVVPVILQLVTALAPLIATIFSELMPVILQLVESFMPLVEMIIQSVVPVVMTLIKAFMPLIEQVLPILMSLINLLMPIIKLLVDLFVGNLKSAILVITAVIQLLTGNFEGFGKTFTQIFEHVKSFGKTVVNDIIGIFEGMINFVIDGINRMISFINTIKVTVPDWIRDLLKMKSNTFGFNLPQLSRVSIPRLAKGGVVAPSAGGTIAQIAEAGKPERVEPLDANGMSKRDKYITDLIKAQQGNAGTINITVNPAPGMDERELASAISREISFQMRRGAVA